MIAPMLFIPNITLPSNGTTLSGLGQYDNGITFGLFGVAISAIIWVIICVGLVMKDTDIEIAGLVASFIDVFITLVMIGLQWTTPYLIIVYLAAAALFFVMILTRGASETFR